MEESAYSEFTLFNKFYQRPPSKYVTLLPEMVAASFQDNNDNDAYSD